MMIYQSSTKIDGQFKLTIFVDWTFCINRQLGGCPMPHGYDIPVPI